MHNVLVDVSSDNLSKSHFLCKGCWIEANISLTAIWKASLTMKSPLWENENATFQWLWYFLAKADVGWVNLCNNPRQVLKNSAVPPTDSTRFSMEGNVSPMFVCIENIAARISRSILKEILFDMHWSAKITTRRSYFGDKCRTQNDRVILIALTLWQVLF